MNKTCGRRYRKIRGNNMQDKERVKNVTNDEKLKSPGKNRTTSSRKIVIDDFDINVIRRTIKDFRKIYEDSEEFHCRLIGVHSYV
ncbi:hypothetical protein L9F63_024893, partial [Diploptera punctata]